MKWSSYFILFSFLYWMQPSSSIAIASEYPKKVQRAIESQIQKHSIIVLAIATAQYNEERTDPHALQGPLQHLGFSKTDQALILEASNVKQLPIANFMDGEIQIRDSGFEISIGAQELGEHAIRVNGQVFRWNSKATARENITSYERLFQSKAEWSVFKVANAEGGNFKIKAAGLQLFFKVSARTENGKELLALGEKVKELLEACKSPPVEGEGDKFLTLVFEEMRKVNQYGGKVEVFRNCGDILEYSRKPFLLSGPQPVREVPADLCKNLDELAKCVRALNVPDSKKVSKSKKKEKADPEEWNEGAPPAGRGEEKASDKAK